MLLLLKKVATKATFKKSSDKMGIPFGDTFVPIVPIGTAATSRRLVAAVSPEFIHFSKK